MQWFRLRPTFAIDLRDTRDEAIAKLHAAHEQATDQELFRIYGEYGELHLPVNQHRLWSPHLSFYVSDASPCSILHGRFAPRLDVWTVIWIAYLFASFSAFFGAMLAISQWQVAEQAWGFWVMCGSLVILLAIYVVAHLGQQWSADQMQSLRDQLETIMLKAGIQSVPRE
jgi:hypothetical protein